MPQYRKILAKIADHEVMVVDCFVSLPKTVVYSATFSLTIQLMEYFNFSV